MAAVSLAVTADDSAMRVLPLEDVHDASCFGGKAAALGAARRAGLPVPPGHAVSAAALAAIVRGDATLIARLHAQVATLRAPLAARSSAVGEDAAATSFAGQHASFLNLQNDAGLLQALRGVHASAHAPAALAYREKRGIAGEIQIGAVVQELVDPICAGVLFTRNPVTGDDERVIEAAWGLGETVVAGAVIPDHYRLGRDGRVLEARIGDKELASRRAADGGTSPQPVAAELIAAACLDGSWLARLHTLALSCEALFGSAIDLEWARVGDELVLLQCRPISTGSTSAT